MRKFAPFENFPQYGIKRFSTLEPDITLLIKEEKLALPLELKM